jgi:hypothetical protein
MKGGGRMIRVLDHYNIKEHMCDPCVMDVDSFTVELDGFSFNNDYAEAKLTVGETYYGRKIIAAFIHPESGCAWIIIEGYFEVSFDDYLEGIVNDD